MSDNNKKNLNYIGVLIGRVNELNSKFSFQNEISIIKFFIIMFFLIVYYYIISFFINPKLNIIEIIFVIAVAFMVIIVLPIYSILWGNRKRLEKLVKDNNLEIMFHEPKKFVIFGLCFKIYNISETNFEINKFILEILKKEYKIKKNKYEKLENELGLLINNEQNSKELLEYIGRNFLVLTNLSVISFLLKSYYDSIFKDIDRIEKIKEIFKQELSPLVIILGVIIIIMMFSYMFKSPKNKQERINLLHRISYYLDELEREE